MRLQEPGLIAFVLENTALFFLVLRRFGIICCFGAYFCLVAVDLQSINHFFRRSEQEDLSLAVAFNLFLLQSTCWQAVQQSHAEIVVRQSKKKRRGKIGT